MYGLQAERSTVMLKESSFFALRGCANFGIEMMNAIEAIIVPTEGKTSYDRTLVTLKSHKTKYATITEKSSKMLSETVVEIVHPEGTRDRLAHEMIIVCVPRGFAIEILPEWRNPVVN
jgi:hypothetical protein